MVLERILAAMARRGVVAMRWLLGQKYGVATASCENGAMLGRNTPPPTAQMAWWAIKAENAYGAQCQRQTTRRQQHIAPHITRPYLASIMLASPQYPFVPIRQCCVQKWYRHLGRLAWLWRCCLRVSNAKWDKVSGWCNCWWHWALSRQIEIAWNGAIWMMPSKPCSTKTWSVTSNTSLNNSKSANSCGSISNVVSISSAKVSRNNSNSRSRCSKKSSKWRATDFNSNQTFIEHRLGKWTQVQTDDGSLQPMASSSAMRFKSVSVIVQMVQRQGSGFLHFAQYKAWASILYAFSWLSNTSSTKWEKCSMSTKKACNI